MAWGVVATAVVIGHAAFVLFVLLGGVAVARWRRVAWVHVPAVLWAVAIEWRGAVCPLTPLEHGLRRLAGETGYAGDFLQQYLLSALYPSGLMRETQVVLGAVALAVNMVVYWWVWRRAQTGRTVG